MYRVFALLLFGASLSPTLAQKKLDPLQDSLRKSYAHSEFEKAIDFGTQFCEKLKKEGKAETVDWADAQTDMSSSYLQLQQLREAEKTTMAALAVHQKLLGPKDLKVGRDLMVLADILSGQGKKHIADSVYHLVLPIYLAHYKESDMEMGMLYINMGGLLTDLLDLPKAEAYLVKGTAIIEAIDSLHGHAANGHNNLASLYFTMQNIDKALVHIHKAVHILEHTSGGINPNLGLFYTNLGNIYGERGRWDMVEKYAAKGAEALIRQFGESHPYVAFNFLLLANSAMATNQFQKADLYFRRSEKAVESSDLGPDLKVGFFTNQLTLYSALGNIPAMDSAYQKALKLTREIQESDVLGSMAYPLFSARGRALRSIGKHDQAEAAYRESNKLIQRQLLKIFPYLSDQGKADFLEKVSLDLNEIRSTYFSRVSSKPAIAADLYDQQLATKALLLNSAAKWKQRIKTSGDLKLIQMYSRWSENQTYLSNLYQNPEAAKKRELDSCQALNESLEKELSRRSESFARLSEKAPVSWKQVQAKLKPGEAAAEVIRMRAWGLDRMMTDSSDPQRKQYPLHGFVDSSFYAVLIVKPGLAYPQLVVLPRGKEMEGKGLAYYRKCTERQRPDKQSYTLFWKAIGNQLKGIRRIYFSPDGVFHSLNLNTLQNSQTGKYLLEEMEISLVTSTKDLLLPRKEEELNQLAYLFGYPNYNASLATQMQAAEKQRNSPELIYAINKVRGEGFGELPGTKVEVESIASVLKSKSWEVNTLEGDQALEETLKESLKPRVLHLATHGFFDPDTTPGSNPLLHSGLLLAGANRSFSGEKSEKTEDGILTAYEAMNLNLDNTDLVVLSACETGLGEIQNGEGVYGLQRAFKVAGARSLIMSLWKVDDEATQELMVSFYKNWLSSPNSTKRSAFLKAQKELKAKYPQPYFWGAFVMVGE